VPSSANDLEEEALLDEAVIMAKAGNGPPSTTPLSSQLENPQAGSFATNFPAPLDQSSFEEKEVQDMLTS
jgi:hypothetical protein